MAAVNLPDNPANGTTLPLMELLILTTLVRATGRPRVPAEAGEAVRR